MESKFREFAEEKLFSWRVLFIRILDTCPVSNIPIIINSKKMASPFNLFISIDRRAYYVSNRYSLCSLYSRFEQNEKENKKGMLCAFNFAINHQGTCYSRLHTAKYWAVNIGIAVRFDVFVLFVFFVPEANHWSDSNSLPCEHGMLKRNLHVAYGPL